MDVKQQCNNNATTKSYTLTDQPEHQGSLTRDIAVCPQHYGVECSTVSLCFILQLMKKCISGPGCPELMTSLVNVLLKFQTLISEILQYFLSKKCEKLLQCKSFSHFFNKKFQCIWLLILKHLTVDLLISSLTML